MTALNGRKVVVTGAIAGHSRQTAEAALASAGALVQSSVSATTDLLVTGARVGASKLAKAETLGIQIVPWEDVWGDAPVRTPTRVVAPTPRSAEARIIAPMLAKAAKELPTGDAWLHEVKWDGYRCVATVKDGRVSMQSRSGKSQYAESYPRVAAALCTLPDCVLDGELVVMDEHGAHSLETMSNGHEPEFVVFDVLEIGAQDLRRVPFEARRKELVLLFEECGLPVKTIPLALSDVFTDGEKLLAEVERLGLEGIVAKRKSSPYREGSRDGWVKVKIRREQEFVVLGWIEGEGEAAGGPASLLLALPDDDGVLEYVGKVGTGGTWALWMQFAELDELVFAPMPKPASMSTPEFESVHWVEAECVVQVQFQRWTSDGRLWHPSLIAIRHDKPAHEVVREVIR